MTEQELADMRSAALRNVDNLQLTEQQLKIGGRYNWQYQPERLIYLGKAGYWHQFAEVAAPGVVWCEVLENYLQNFEETTE